MTPQQLEALLNGLLKNEEKVPYAFYVEDAELAGEIGAAMLAKSISVEKVVSILYRPQAVFRVRPVGRCTASMAGARACEPLEHPHCGVRALMTLCTIVHLCTPCIHTGWTSEAPQVWVSSKTLCAC
jgi:NLE (NUC135) domain